MSVHVNRGGGVGGEKDELDGRVVVREEEGREGGGLEKKRIVGVRGG